MQLLPDQPEALGLLALMLLHDARRDTRVGADGALVPLEEQDRSRWERTKITEGLDALDRAIAMRRRGPYQVQAAIAALHAKAGDASSTDWVQIAALYGALYAMMPTAIVELNAAAAVAMVEGPKKGLEWIDRAKSRRAVVSRAPAARSRRLSAETIIDAQHAACLKIEEREKRKEER